MGLKAIIATAALLMGSSVAHGATIEVLPAGQLAPAQADNLVTFDRMPAAAYGSTAPSGSFFAGGATFSGSALVMRNGQDGSLPAIGLYAEPYHDTSNYLAILGNGSETVSFTSMRTSFGLYWGSIGEFDSIAFYEIGRLKASFSGSDITPLVPIPYDDQFNDGSNRYVTFHNLGSFDTVVLATATNSFELDNITSSVPEPSTWAMMLIGFGGLGYLACRRTRQSNISTAAVAA